MAEIKIEVSHIEQAVLQVLEDNPGLVEPEEKFQLTIAIRYVGGEWHAETKVEKDLRTGRQSEMLGSDVFTEADWEEILSVVSGNSSGPRNVLHTEIAATVDALRIENTPEYLSKMARTTFNIWCHQLRLPYRLYNVQFEGRKINPTDGVKMGRLF